MFDVFKQNTDCVSSRDLGENVSSFDHLHISMRNSQFLKDRETANVEHPEDSTHDGREELEGKARDGAEEPAEQGELPIVHP